MRGRAFFTGMGDALRRRLVSLGGLTLITVAGAFVVALAGYDPADPSLNAVGASGAAIANPLGLPGAVAADLMLQSLGLATAVPALLLGAWGWRLVSGRGVPRPALRLAFLPMVILGACFALAVVTPRHPGRCGRGSADLSAASGERGRTARDPAAGRLTILVHPRARRRGRRGRPLGNDRAVVHGASRAGGSPSPAARSRVSGPARGSA